MTPVANANRAALFASMVRADTGFLDFFIPPAEKKIMDEIKYWKAFLQRELVDWIVNLSIKIIVKMNIELVCTISIFN